MDKGRIIFRADGNKKIGYGHVSRLLSIAERMRSRYRCVFITRSPDTILQKNIRAVCHELICLPPLGNLKQEAELLAKKYISKNDIVVTDGYSFNEDYQRIVSDQCKKLVCVDDEARFNFYAHAVINHAGEKIKNRYKTADHTRLFLGLRYALVRSCFRKKARILKPVKNVFLCLGGSDKERLVKKLLKCLRKAGPELRIHVVSGKKRSGGKKSKITYHPGLPAPKMARLMNQCQLVICPSSTLSIEALHMCLPVFTGLTAQNQENIHKTIARFPWVKAISSFDKIPEEKLVMELRNFTGKIANFTGERIDHPVLKRSHIEEVFR